MTGAMCDDNRFELIEKYKNKLIDGTNIETAKDEMAVIENILFRFWQMGWLDKLEEFDRQKAEVEENSLKIEHQANIIKILEKALGIKQAEVEKLKAESQMADGYAEALVERTKSEAIKEFQQKSKNMLNKLYKRYYRLANRTSNMFYRGRAEAMWECICRNDNLVKEMVGEEDV